MMRRTFLVGSALAARALSGLGRSSAAGAAQPPASTLSTRVSIGDVKDGEDGFAGRARALPGPGRSGPAGAAQPPASTLSTRVSIGDVKDGEDVFAWLTRVHGGY